MAKWPEKMLWEKEKIMLKRSCSTQKKTKKMKNKKLPSSIEYCKCFWCIFVKCSKVFMMVFEPVDAPQPWRGRQEAGPGSLCNVYHSTTYEKFRIKLKFRLRGCNLRSNMVNGPGEQSKKHNRTQNLSKRPNCHTITECPSTQWRKTESMWRHGQAS